MANFTNPTIRNKTLSNWSLQNVPQILPYLHVIPSEERRDFIIKFVAQFEQEVLAKKDQLVHSIIHNDLNEQNILVQKQLEHGTEVAHVYGIIDFGDVEYAPVLFDLGILVAYIMLICECVDPVLVAPNLVLRGYTQTITNNARFMLSRQDIGRIFICAKARLCQSLTLGAYTHSLYPDNDYLLATAKQGWKLLQRLATVDSDDLVENWCQGLELKDWSTGSGFLGTVSTSPTIVVYLLPLLIRNGVNVVSTYWSSSSVKTISQNKQPILARL